MYYKGIFVAVIIKEFYEVKDIKLIIIISYYCDLLESFPLERVSFHHLFTTYYRGISVAVSIKEFHQVKYIIL